ncbi:MAG: hypothetical protein IT428_19915 [Planctomycetaceae bacterium]|nr:hypothetical protein [Planctomycetaceae bacterium]
MTSAAPSKATKSNRRKPSVKAAVDDALAFLPTLEQLPATLPKNGITARVHRSMLQVDPLNPRSIDPYAADGLRDSVTRTGGLVDDPIWNRRTGHIVGGHQRLNAEDKRRGTQDYYLSVKVVDWDLKTQREVNVALNNPTIQGQYDVDLLEQLIRDSEAPIDIGAAAFDLPSLEALFLDAGKDLPDALFPSDSPEASAAVQEAAEAVAATLDEADAAKRSEAEAAKIQRLKDDKAKSLAKSAFKAQGNFFFTVVFPTDELREQFVVGIGVDPAAEHIDGMKLAELCGIELDMTAYRKGRKAEQEEQATSSGDESE